MQKPICYSIFKIYNILLNKHNNNYLPKIASTVNYVKVDGDIVGLEFLGYNRL